MTPVPASPRHLVLGYMPPLPATLLRQDVRRRGLAPERPGLPSARSFLRRPGDKHASSSSTSWAWAWRLTAGRAGFVLIWLGTAPTGFFSVSDRGRPKTALLVLRKAINCAGQSARPSSVSRHALALGYRMPAGGLQVYRRLRAERRITFGRFLSNLDPILIIKRGPPPVPRC